MPLSQKNPAWKGEQLGTCDTSISSNGCFVTSLAILTEKTPSEVNQILKDNGGYANGCLVISERAAELLGLEYNGITKEYQNDIAIGETDHYRSSGIPSHFFVWLGNGRIIDPLFGIEMENKYKIINFRLFKPRKETMDLDFIYKRYEPVWRAINNNAIPNKASMTADCQKVLDQLNAGQEWAGADLVQRWVKEKGSIGCVDVVKQCNDAWKTLNDKQTNKYEDEISRLLTKIRKAQADLK